MYTTVSSTNDRVAATEADCELLISGRIRSYSILLFVVRVGGVLYLWSNTCTAFWS